MTVKTGQTNRGQQVRVRQPGEHHVSTFTNGPNQGRLTPSQERHIFRTYEPSLTGEARYFISAFELVSTIIAATRTYLPKLFYLSYNQAASLHTLHLLAVLSSQSFSGGFSLAPIPWLMENTTIELAYENWMKHPQYKQVSGKKCPGFPRVRKKKTMIKIYIYKYYKYKRYGMKKKKKRKCSPSHHSRKITPPPNPSQTHLSRSKDTASPAPNHHWDILYVAAVV